MLVNNFARLLLLNIVFNTYGLEVHPNVKNINILETAAVIRNITNDLFLSLKLKGIKNNLRLKQYALIHNFFTTLTAKDHITLNRIAILSRFHGIDNNNETRNYVNAINELLIEDPINDIESNKNYLLDIVSEFLNKLEYLKENNSVNANYLHINNQIINLLKTKDHYNGSRDESVENSDNEFWVPDQSGRRIFEGKKTKLKYFPFMASIQIFNSFQCAGSIIKSDLIITAASCLQLAWNNRFFRENPAFLSVRVGSKYFKVGGDHISVLEVYFHPSYDPKTLRNNVCLLRLTRKIKFRRKSRIKKIEIDRSVSSLPMETDGITVVGWGATRSDNLVRSPWSTQLAFAVLQIYPLSECQDIYSRGYVTRNNFCAGFFSKGGGACNGDVGGPGIANGILMGIISFGSPVCGTPDAPTVFTKLGYYSDWIESIMEQEVPTTYQRTTLRPPLIVLTQGAKDSRSTTPLIMKPIDSKWKPPSISAIKTVVREEPLRVLKDENLFKEFLSTMFGSDEAREYEEMFINKDIERATKKTKNQLREVKQTKATPETDESTEFEGVDFVTHITEKTTPPAYQVTSLDTNLMSNEGGVKLQYIKDASVANEKATNNDEYLEANVLKMIDNIDINSNDDVNKQVKYAIESKTKELVLPDKNKSYKKDKPKKGTVKTVRDDVLTLLYISDGEKNIDEISSVIDDFDENLDDGLSIALDGFKDFTFRDSNDNGTRSYLLPEDEIYELLAEVIDEVAKGKE